MNPKHLAVDPRSACWFCLKDPQGPATSAASASPPRRRSSSPARWRSPWSWSLWSRRTSAPSWPRSDVRLGPATSAASARAPSGPSCSACSCWSPSGSSRPASTSTVATSPSGRRPRPSTRPGAASARPLRPSRLADDIARVRRSAGRDDQDHPRGDHGRPRTSRATRPRSWTSAEPDPRDRLRAAGASQPAMITTSGAPHRSKRDQRGSATRRAHHAGTRTRADARPDRRRRPGLVRPHDGERGRPFRRPRCLPGPVGGRGRRPPDGPPARSRWPPAACAAPPPPSTVNTAAFGVPVGTPATVTSAVTCRGRLRRPASARNARIDRPRPPPARPPSTPTGADDHAATSDQQMIRTQSVDATSAACRSRRSSP